MDHESSPGLKPFIPDYTPRAPSPPPFAHQGQSPEGDAKHADKDFLRSNKPLNIRIGGKEAHAALLQSDFGANIPDLWRLERENPSSDPSPVDQGFPSRGSELVRTINPSKKLPEPKPVEPGFKPDLKVLAEEALDLDSSSPEAEPPQSPPLQPPGEKRVVLPPLSELVNGPVESIPPPRLDPSPSSIGQAHYNSLPALRNPSAAQSPEDSGLRLPPIQTKLNQLNEFGPVLPPPNGPSPRPVGTPYSLPSVAAVSPPSARVDPSPRELYRAPLMPSKIPPSPYSHLSPASTQAISAVSSPASQQPYWRTVKAPYPYDPPSTVSNRSPASNYPTPIERASTGACEPGAFTPSSQGSTAGPTGTFKCSHPGCTAPPFQTQYLLNSHANVHSQDRPHFCPIEGCSRGPGGKGFKRKNEMIRHGLVHNSPGYVCPFCPDQQHKYPRPDNLQRHVRVHHVDKNKDDPALRHVLAQRPEGSGRGRRRRMNPQ
ncbi:uncharacterized protein DSM5745_08334 [Aspergillus mulundensis]|uniref:Putative C2H2 finger transcription factor n=1 Tax=Aspergillus mulundensis TaxID=1810919 RepID=A0A3D8R9T2_9EURO|nr:putative C2H2 finger transcription factor [Aspergillus mulundensis]RDW70823.1 putative C2H2 finger transcription factor [Aspergillus mulundensis]